MKAGLADAGTALAATGAREEEGTAQAHGTLFRWINFVLLAGGLFFLLRKPLAEFFAQRSASIRKSLEEARTALEASQAQLQAVEDKLRHFEEEMAEFKAAAAREMAVEAEHLRQTTAQEAEKHVDYVRAQLEMATKAAKLELNLYAAQKAVELAEQMIRQRLDEAGHRRLVHQFMARLRPDRNAN